MNQEDKLRHIEGVEKAMTQYCFGQCFNKAKAKNKLVLDFECVSTCYHKYLHSMKTIYETVIDEGRVNKSEFIQKSVGLEKPDRFLDHVFPVGGHPTGMSFDFRRKFYDSYHYSDPLKVGR